MIRRLKAIQFDRRAGSGRTSPGFLVCEQQDGSPVEVVAKISSKCDRGVTSLAMELLCSCLAGDLRLPTPEPFVVEMDLEWIETIPDLEWADAARTSSPLAFGSSRISNGFASWIVGTSMNGTLPATAAGVLAFDIISDNPDRRPDNPNCLQRGEEVRIIDHELCFGSIILGWQPPWQIGALQHLAMNPNHIFYNALRKRAIDWTPVIAAWEGLSDDDVADYEAAMPAEWSDALPHVRTAIGKIKDARDNIRGCIAEIQRILAC